MRAKRTKYLLIIITGLLFIVASFVYYDKYCNYDNLTIDYRMYNNINEHTKFSDTIEKKYKIDTDNLYLVNGGEIEVDSKGNIIDLYFETLYIKDDTIYNLSIELDEMGDYKLINDIFKSNMVNFDVLISMSEFLGLVSIIEPYLYEEETTIIMLEPDVPGNVKYNSIYESYVVSNEGIIKVDKDIIGKYFRISLLNKSEKLKNIYIEKK